MVAQLAVSMSEFDAAAQATFKASMVATVGGDVSAADISLAVSAGSITVAATIRTPTLPAAEAAAKELARAIDTTAASGLFLGLPVAATPTQPTSRIIVHAAPAPPTQPPQAPPPPPSPPRLPLEGAATPQGGSSLALTTGGDSGSSAMIIVLAAAAGVLVAAALVGLRVRRRRRSLAAAFDRDGAIGSPKQGRVTIRSDRDGRPHQALRSGLGRLLAGSSRDAVGLEQVVIAQPTKTSPPIPLSKQRSSNTAIEQGVPHDVTMGGAPSAADFSTGGVAAEVADLPTSPTSSAPQPLSFTSSSRRSP